MYKKYFKRPCTPAATVILMRDDLEDDCFEVLLLKRSSRLDFHGGHWVFPGGRIDQKDYQQASDHHNIIEAARYAAVRETFEESGLAIIAQDLVLMSQWTTPRGFPKRFKTWFFLCHAPSGKVTIDNQEIKAYQWQTPKKAITANSHGHIHLPVPTLYTLQCLTEFSSIKKALTHYSANQPMAYE